MKPGNPDTYNDVNEWPLPALPAYDCRMAVLLSSIPGVASVCLSECLYPVWEGRGALLFILIVNVYFILFQSKLQNGDFLI